MADTTDIKKGYKMLIDRTPYVVVDYQFVKPGKGQAFYRTKLKNMVTGAVLDRTFKSGEKVEKADTEERAMQYLYQEGEQYVFMDNETYDQMRLTGDLLGEAVYFLLDNMNIDVMLFEGRPIGITPPTFVELDVVETEPGFKGDTSSNTTKPATLQTGLTVNVPLFVEVGDKLKVDTRTGDYVERVKV
ncbi:MAG: elongation factor P [Sandaracinus sp.]|nr:elongation factor P [Sandaracinus sp.]|tara:strand:- start:59 stop:622 length:564 start_codon:yes stop_codon:yes gene_type:complete